ncbi:MAG: type II secretion system GspH family protein [Betaproteobacteria bacterium]|nr:type II secretion system GspH family protein [Betaproteobacteria bacterium]
MRVGPLRRAQRGLSLIVALVSLVVMIVAGFALFRSVDNANMASMNYQFMRSAEQNADMAFNDAILAFMQSHPTASLNVMDRNTDQPTLSYYASQREQNADGIPLPLAQLAAPSLNADGVPTSDWPGAAVDTASRQMRRYLIERLCTATGPATAANCRLYEYRYPRNCMSNCGAATTEWLPFVRITVRIDGPKNSVAYAQMFLKGD